MRSELNDKNNFATQYLLQWMEALKKERINNPEALIEREPDFYIGGQKLQPRDSIFADVEGLPRIIRAKCFQ
jgi:hypothetical protein